jgi:hypothetical protein
MQFLGSDLTKDSQSAFTTVTSAEILAAIGYTPAAINPNTGTNDTAFPIGTVLLVSLSGMPARNGTATVRLSGTAGFAVAASGTALAGTWRYCGSINTSDYQNVDITAQYYFAVMQRVA